MTVNFWETTPRTPTPGNAMQGAFSARLRGAILHAVQNRTGMAGDSLRLRESDARTFQ
jgi:hypothetical protein